MKATPAALALAAMLAAGLAAPAAVRAGDEAPPQPKAPVRAYVGIRLLSVRGFDAGAGVFDAHLHLSVRWPAASGLDLSTIGFANGVAHDREPVEDARSGRWRRAVWRVAASFHGSFPLEDFPFDPQALRIEVEHPTIPASALTLLPDLEASGIAPGFDIPGWRFERSFGAHSTVATPDARREDAPAERSRVVFAVYLSRPRASLLAKILVPLLVVLAMSHAAFWIEPRDASTRFMLVTTGIFVAVCVQFVLSGTIPDVDYVTVADVYFIVVYVFLFAELCAAVASHRLVLAGRDAAVARLDHAVRWLAPPLALAAAVASTYPAAAEKPAAARPGVEAYSSARPELVMGIVERPVAFGPWCEADIEYMVTRLVMDPLVEPDAADVPTAIMATEVPSFANGRIKLRDDGSAVVRLSLRPGRWGDGTPVTPDDWAPEGPLLTFDGARAVRAEGGEIVVEYDRPRPAALFDTFLFPRHRLAGADAAALTRDVPPHSGPFILERFGADELVLRRNPYHVPPAALERVVIRVFADRGALAAAVRKREVQLVPPGQLELPSATALARDVRGTVAQSVDTNYVWHLDVNLDHPVLADRRVRQALLLGLDREAMVREVLGGNGAVAHSWLYERHPGYHAGIRRWPYDPPRANALLDEAGYARGADGRRRGPDGEPLRFEVARADRYPKLVFEIIRRSWAALGVEAADDPVEYGHYMNVTTSQMRWKHFAFWAYSLESYNTGHDYWMPGEVPTAENDWAGLNYCRWRDPRVAELHERLETTFNPDDAIDLFERQQDIWAEELPCLTLYTDRAAYVAASSLKGFRPHALGPAYFTWNAAEWRFVE